MRVILVGALLLASVLAGVAEAGNVKIVDATASPSGSDRYAFEVTLRHDDTGWDHYADAWDVLAPDGAVLGERVLLHPHLDEQPFTRGLSGVVIPAGMTWVHIRARDKVHGHGEELFRVNLPGR